MTVTTYKDIEKKYGEAIKAFKKATVIRGSPPSEVSSEIDNALSHLVIHFGQNGDDETKKQLRKAENHLERATLDSLKIIWLEYWAIFTDILSHPIRSRIRFGKEWKGLRDRMRAGMDELYVNSKKTRVMETENVGTGIQKSITCWRKIIDKVESNVFPEDNDLSVQVLAAYKESLRRSEFRRKWAPEIITFSVGLAASLLFAVIADMFA